jgi:hypothetical protein
MSASPAAKWLLRYNSLSSGTEHASLIVEAARVMTEFMPVDELRAELRRQNAIIERIYEKEEEYKAFEAGYQKPKEKRQKPRTLQEIYQLKWSDYEMEKYQEKPLITKEEWDTREALHLIANQHDKWFRYASRAGKMPMEDGTMVYLYRGPYETMRERIYFENRPSSLWVEEGKAWKAFVKTKQNEFWRKNFGCQYNPLCANDCMWNRTYCQCGDQEGISFHGLKLVNGQTVISDEVIEARATEAAELAQADAELAAQRAEAEARMAKVNPNHPQCVVDMMAEVASWGVKN